MNEKDTTTVSHVVDKVTVYEDRADVVRSASVSLSAGAHALRFAGLSPLIDEERLIARYEGDGHVDDIVVVRKWIDDGADELLKRREERARAREKLADEQRAAQDEVDHASFRQRAAEQALSLWRRSTARKLGRGSDGADVDATLQKFRDELLAATEQLQKAAEKHQRLAVALHKIQLDEKKPVPSRQRRVCDVIVRVSSKGGAAKVVLTTLVPCAAWRPTHEARLLRGEKPAVHWITHGAVWNRTGENWRDATLVLSTARPALGAELPPLAEDRLRLRQKTAEERKTITVEHRVERVPPSATQGGAPGVDDGGEARVFSVANASVPDDGRPHALQLATFDAPCSLAKVCIPEKAPQVFLRASFKNAGRGPILAGPVTLVDDGAWVGTGDVLFTGAGDDLDLSFGSDDRLWSKINKRVIVEKKLVGKNIDHYLQEVTLSSTSTSKEEVVVLLRLPVSELAQVKVLQSPQHGTEGDLKLDSHGLARVNAVVEPGKDKRVACAFSFDTSGDVNIPAPWN